MNIDKDGEIYIIFDQKQVDDREFFAKITTKDFRHIDGIIECNEKYNLGLTDLRRDTNSYEASRLVSALGHLVLLVENNSLVAFIPKEITENENTIVNGAKRFISRHKISFLSLYEGENGRYYEKSMDFNYLGNDVKPIQNQVEVKLLDDDDRVNKKRAYREFKKEIKNKFKIKNQEKTK